MSMAMEFSHVDIESTEEELLFSRRRCCYWIPSFSFSKSSSTVGRTFSNNQGIFSRGISALKKLREWSEIMAGPRWKTFIRRFNSGGGGGRSGKFHYDEFSYALNFDQGPGQTGNPEEEDDHLRRNFSSRYATFSVSKQLRDDFQASSSSSSSQLIVS